MYMCVYVCTHVESPSIRQSELASIPVCCVEFVCYILHTKISNLKPEGKCERCRVACSGAAVCD